MFCIDVCILLQKELNFTYDVYKPIDNAWGNKQPDGTWDGIIGRLAARETDIGELLMRSMYNIP